MKIEISIAEAQFLKLLVSRSDAWNNGDRIGDVYIKLTEALHEEGGRLIQEARARGEGK